MCLADNTHNSPKLSDLHFLELVTVIKRDFAEVRKGMELEMSIS